ncbi:hypothetical protein DYBT9275_04027 [Dyadobacter sp. CECT 9275]|uniref:DUF4260 family protein n=1 Tax=Dyadobacter helix TaxID=2822344 RepID=A0A916JF66_9BACT|nr:DUF4260 domain-containing protein [Dyadobacter sp. CECT 9275]CAG5007354.1 hypothetical protein DYBT9275_04027 [Dyadobacter sp. CECT 9275]
MKNLIKLEEAAEFVFAIFLFSKLNFAWWVFPALLLLPDLSMIGYTLGTKTGAVFYNIVHHKALGIAVGVLGFVMGHQMVMLAGIILFAHSAMDRFFGYGLKYSDDFKHTHLGKIGK